MVAVELEKDDQLRLEKERVKDTFKVLSLWNLVKLGLGNNS